MKTTFAQKLIARAAASLLIAGVVLAAAPAAPVAAMGEPVNRTAPAVSGRAGVNTVISTRSGVWTNNPSSYGYQWYACENLERRATNVLPNECTAIAGATARTLRITRAIIEEYARNRTYFLVGVTATNESGSAVKFSKSTLHYVRAR
jgi:hypothetical protein